MGAWLSLLLLYSYADGPSTEHWLEGGELAARLRTPISVTWSGQPVREALHSLAEVHRVSVLLDRRVDPGRPVELALSGVPLGEALGQLAGSVGCGYAQLGPIAYVGPQPVAERLRTLSAALEEVAGGLPASLRHKAKERGSLAWPDLATPRGLLEQLAATGGLELAGLDQVPHDLWGAADLAPLSWMDRVLVVSVQFDLWPQPTEDGRALTLRPIPEQVLLERSYPGGSDPRRLAQRWSRLAPHCQIEVQGKRVVVRGLLEDHERLHQGPRSARTPRASQAGEARIKRLKLRGQLGDVLRSIATSYELTLDLDRAALAASGTPADTLVELEVEDTTLEEALHRLLDPLKLGFRLEKGSLHVFPAKEH